MSINPAIFKAYDVRGLYPQEINEEAARLIGRGFVSYLGARRIAVSRDMRLSSPSLAQAFIEGATEQGADVVDYGMMGTDMMYFAVARDGHDGGVQITASHNPKEYNGIKMVRKEAFPLSGESGIGDIRDMIAARTAARARGPARHGHDAELIEDYVEKVMSFIDPAKIKPFNVVLDAGNGMAGLVAPRLFANLPCKVTQMCFEIDGTFPNHEANPLIEENRRDIVERVVRDKADIGIAWDGDADRVFFIDGSGEFIAGDFVTALLAEAFLLKHRGDLLLSRRYSVRNRREVRRPSLMNRGGPRSSARMRERAIFGVSPGHTTSVLLLRRQRFTPRVDLGCVDRADLARVMTELREKYFISGEINTKLSDMSLIPAKLDALSAKYTDGRVYSLDGTSVEYPDWHFNVRASNTEPMLRLNLEATTQELMEQKRDEVLAFIRFSSKRGQSSEFSPA